MAIMQFRFIPIDIRHIVQITLLSVVISYSSYANDPNDRLVIEELRREFYASNDIAKKAMILYDYCLYFQVKDYQVDSVLHYAQVLLDFSIKENYPPAEVLGQRMFGSQYARINEFEKSKFHLYKSIQLAKSSNYLKYLHDSYNPLAKTYYHQNKLDSALYYFEKCLESAPQDLHSKHYNFHVGLSVVYGQLGRLDAQEKHLLLSHDHAIKGGIKMDQLIILLYLTDFYSLTRKDPILYNKFRKLYDDMASKFGDFSDSFHSYIMKFDSIPYGERVTFLKESLDDNMKKGFVDGAFLGFIALQHAYYNEGNYIESEKVGSDAIAYYKSNKSIRLKVLLEIYDRKWRAESKLDNPQRAFETVNIYHELKDSLNAANNSKHINELSIKYESAKKDAKLSEGELKINSRTAQRNYALLLAGLLLSFGYFFWRRSNYKRLEIEAENKLQSEKIDNLEKERKILSLTSMIAGQEAERTRIAQDLHDGLGGLLSSVRNHFSLIQEEVKKLDSLNVYDRTNSMIDQACKEVRRISHNLMPASLQLNGLIATVDQYCRDVEVSKNIEVHFEHIGIDNIQLGETKLIFIYRIIQEGVNNVLKHAEASSLLVQLALYDSEITLIIEDDGKGFDMKKMNDGIGLKSIKSRVDHLGGELEVDSKIDSGTTITINIPYEYSQN